MCRGTSRAAACRRTSTPARCEAVRCVWSQQIDPKPGGGLRDASVHGSCLNQTPPERAGRQQKPRRKFENDSYASIGSDQNNRLKEALNKSELGVCTAKRLCNLAQGWRVARLPWDRMVVEVPHRRGCVSCSSRYGHNP